MQIKTIEVKRVRNLGNFESRSLTLHCELDPNKDTDRQITSALRLCDFYLEKMEIRNDELWITEQDLEEAKNEAYFA